MENGIPLMESLAAWDKNIEDRINMLEAKIASQDCEIMKMKAGIVAIMQTIKVKQLGGF